MSEVDLSTGQLGQTDVARTDVEPTEAEPTGDGVVDGALADLDALDPEAPPEEHVRVLDVVHQALQQRLSATQA